MRELQEGNIQLFLQNRYATQCSLVRNHRNTPSCSFLIYHVYKFALLHARLTFLYEPKNGSWHGSCLTKGRFPSGFSEPEFSDVCQQTHIQTVCVWRVRMCPGSVRERPGKGDLHVVMACLVHFCRRLDACQSWTRLSQTSAQCFFFWLPFSWCWTFLVCYDKIKENLSSELLMCCWRGTALSVHGVWK